MNAATRRHLELDTPRRRRQPHTPCSACSIPRSRRWAAACCGAGCIDRCATAASLRLRHQAVATLIDSARRRSPARALPRAGRPRTHPLAHRPALGAAARPVDAARRPGACCRPCARCSRRWIRRAWPTLAAELGEHDEHAAPARLAPSSPQPPVLARDGGVFADGYDAELDELRTLSTNADQFLIDLEARERAATGIATLKVGYNRVHGYYIEISKGQADKAPTHYTRRQTLTGAERYITEELKQFEDKVLSARERSLARETPAVRTTARRAERAPGAAEALRRGVVRTRRAGLLRRARAVAGLVAARAAPTSPACASSAAAIRWWRRCAASRSSPTTWSCDDGPPHAGDHRPEHGRQVDLHAPERADRAAGAYRQLRAGVARA